MITVPSRRTVRVKVSSEVTAQTEAIAQVFLELDSRDNRGYVGGHVWAQQWSLNDIRPTWLVLQFEDGEVMKVFLSSCNVTVSSDSCSLEADFIAESYVGT